jgi:hypothetical protein
VSQQMQSSLYDYYGWDPYWAGSYFGVGSMDATFPPSPYYSAVGAREAAETASEADDADPHLRSVSAVKGYHIRASDGEIGHIQNFLIDDAVWSIRYLIVDTSNWWFGKHVLVSPYAVKTIEWSDRAVSLEVDRDQVKASPPWNPADRIDQAYEERLHKHYGWPGYGW